jgi:hypothetical protein
LRPGFFFYSAHRAMLAVLRLPQYGVPKMGRDQHAELFAEIDLAIQIGVAQIDGAVPAEVTKRPEQLSVRKCVSGAAPIASNGRGNLRCRHRSSRGAAPMRVTYPLAPLAFGLRSRR